MSLSPSSPPVSSSFDLKLARMSSSPQSSSSPPDGMMKTAPPRQRRLTSKGLEVISKPLKPFASADIKIRSPPPSP